MDRSEMRVLRVRRALPVRRVPPVRPDHPDFRVSAARLDLLELPARRELSDWEGRRVPPALPDLRVFPVGSVRKGPTASVVFGGKPDQSVMTVTLPSSP